MKRRLILAGLAGAGLTGLADATFRWHATPRLRPALTRAHLQALAAAPPAAPRVLFLGNSMTLRHGLVERIARRAKVAGIGAGFATAAANGARLIETQQVDALELVLARGWDVLVMQDLSTVSLRAPDRWGSAHAMRVMARKAHAGAVLLYPTWAFPPGHWVYEKGGGFLSAVPEGPDSFARSITSHYGDIAARQGWVRAPVTEAMAEDPTHWLEQDLHHPNVAGTERIAGVLWQSLAPLLAA